MDSYENNTSYDLKFIDAVKHVKKYKCCPNDTFPKIDYTFLLTRHYGINHKTIITPAIGRHFLINAKTQNKFQLNNNNAFFSFDISHFDGALVGFEIDRTNGGCERELYLPSALHIRLALAIAI